MYYLYLKDDTCKIVKNKTLVIKEICSGLSHLSVNRLRSIPVHQTKMKAKMAR